MSPAPLAAQRAGAAVAPGRRPDRAAQPGSKHAPGLRVIQRRRARRRAGVLAIGSLLLVFGLLFGIVALQAVIAAGQQRLDRMDVAVGQAKQDRQRLELVVAELEAPRTIVAAARDRLGMVTPEDITYLTPTGGAAIEAQRAADVGAQRQATGR
jgi:cell division protein FtsB